MWKSNRNSLLWKYLDTALQSYKGSFGGVCVTVFRCWKSVTAYSLNCALQHLLQFTMFAVPCKENHVIYNMFCFIGSRSCRLGCVMDSCYSTTHVVIIFLPNTFYVTHFATSTELTLFLVRPKHEAFYGYKQMIYISDIYWLSVFISF